MDEPTHANESRFWDQVADWLLDGACALSQAARPASGAESPQRMQDDDTPPQ